MNTDDIVGNTAGRSFPRKTRKIVVLAETILPGDFK